MKHYFAIDPKTGEVLRVENGEWRPVPDGPLDLDRDYRITWNPVSL